MTTHRPGRRPLPELAPDKVDAWLTAPPRRDWQVYPHEDRDATRVDPLLAPLNDADRQLMADLGLTADESWAGAR